MKATEVRFLDYLREEVDHAGKRYEIARKKVFVLTAVPEIQAGPELLEATEVLSKDMKSYISTLRRLAHYVARNNVPVARKELVQHA